MSEWMGSPLGEGEEKGSNDHWVAGVIIQNKMRRIWKWLSLESTGKMKLSAI